MLKQLHENIEIVNLKGSFIRLMKELKVRHVDFLLPVYTAMRALLAKFFLGGPFKVILSQRNMFTMDRGYIQTKLRFMRCRILYPLASACVCISHGVADEMKSLNLIDTEKLHVIYNPVVTTELLRQAEAPIPHRWLTPGQPPVILGVGRLGDQKDFSTLIRAFAIVAEKREQVRLVILGEGRQRKMLEELIKTFNLSDRAILPGYDPNPYSWMSRAALFVMTSRFEGFGNVAAESLACGCNVVAADCRSGPSEILDGGRYGKLAKVGDPEDVARAIVEALDNPLPPEMLKRRASFFSEENSVSAYCKLMNELILNKADSKCLCSPSLNSHCNSGGQN